MVHTLVELSKATFIAQHVTRKRKVREGVRVCNVCSVSGGGSCMRGVMAMKGVQGAFRQEVSAKTLRQENEVLLLCLVELHGA